MLERTIHLGFSILHPILADRWRVREISGVSVSAGSRVIRQCPTKPPHVNHTPRRRGASLPSLLAFVPTETGRFSTRYTQTRVLGTVQEPSTRRFIANEVSDPKPRTVANGGSFARSSLRSSYEANRDRRQARIGCRSCVLSPAPGADSATETSLGVL